MRILFTGASSFTGYWFASELARSGHEVSALFRRPVAAYAGIRGERVRGLTGSVHGVHGPSFGSPEFLDFMAAEGPFDLLCHHAAEVRDYHSPEFDVAAAVASNTRGLGQTAELLARSGGALLVTGSFFEAGEGAGSEPLEAVSPYGLSKGLSAQIARFYARRSGIGFGKFVIPNPFGPFEDERFGHYLMRCWFGGEVASVRTPDYVRDNLHVTLMARAYRHFAEQLAHEGGDRKLNPSGYVERQGAFATRVAREMRPRLGLACDLELETQKDFPEPRMRINTQPCDAEQLGWSEQEAWDELARYYDAHLGRSRRP